MSDRSDADKRERVVVTLSPHCDSVLAGIAVDHWAYGIAWRDTPSRSDHHVFPRGWSTRAEPEPAAGDSTAEGSLSCDHAAGCCRSSLGLPCNEVPTPARRHGHPCDHAAGVCEDAAPDCERCADVASGSPCNESPAPSPNSQGRPVDASPAEDPTPVTHGTAERRAPSFGSTRLVELPEPGTVARERAECEAARIQAARDEDHWSPARWTIDTSIRVAREATCKRRFCPCKVTP